MGKFTEMKQKELRAACKAAGLTGYGNATQDQMRDMLRNHQIDNMTATEALDADIADVCAVQLSPEDKQQIAAEADDRTNGALPKDSLFTGEDDDEDLSDIPPEMLAAEDEFEAGMAEELAKRQAAEAAKLQADLDAEANHPMVAGKAPVATVATKPARAPSGTSNGLKIEANRDTANGVSRPSAGGKCRAVWDMLDGIGLDATAKQAREQAATLGYDKTTTMVQFYRWRKFHGIAGRQ